MSHKEFSMLVTSRARRSLKRGLTENEKRVLEAIKKNKTNVRTHSREMVILPEMVNKTIKVHNGKEFVAIMISIEMLGHTLGEFAMTRKKVEHHAPGIGATRSSASLSVK
jgi:small subunit ribosomal protein S19